MGLDIAAERHSTMLRVIELCSDYYSSWADVLRHPPFRWKSIDPHCGKVYQLHHNKIWYELEGKRVTDSPNSFFHHPNLSFNLGHMLICSGDVEDDTKVRHLMLEGSKFPIHT